MQIKRLFLASFFALALAVSGMSSIVPANAENDTTSAPVLHEAEAKNTGGTSTKEAGDSVVLEFSETTNKFPITAANIMTELDLSSSHSFLDGAGALGSATWSDDGEKLSIVFSAATSIPTVAVGDTVTVSGTNIKDLSGVTVTGNAVIGGSFTSFSNSEEECKDSDQMSTSSRGDDDGDEDEVEDEDFDEDENEDEDNDDEIAENDDEDIQDEQDDCDDDGDEDDHGKYRCGTGLQNGTLYKVDGSDTVYLMADCRLKPFRGQAAFNSRGLKFDDSIKTLSALPSGVSMSDKPALPAEGTLIKGSDKTVWFVAKNGKRKGFTSAEVFTGLGFKFDQVDQITDSDLGTIETDSDLVDDNSEHPDGALIKCGNSTAIFVVIDKLRFPFANLDSFESRGHSFEHVLNVDCGRFGYQEAPAIQ